MNTPYFIVGRNKLIFKKDPTSAIYLEMLMKRMQNENEVVIRCSKSTCDITDGLISLITKSCGWFLDDKEEKTVDKEIWETMPDGRRKIKKCEGETRQIIEYKIKRIPAIELPDR